MTIERHGSHPPGVVCRPAGSGLCEPLIVPTECTAERFGDHDYRQPPHNTPDEPRDARDLGPCQAQSAESPFGACGHERRYEVVVFQIGSHEWIRLFACAPCTATLRKRHHKLGPRGSEGIARVRDAIPTKVPDLSRVPLSELGERKPAFNSSV